MAGAGKKPLKGSMLISHTHWDHIQGFPFFTPLFIPGGHWDIYGPAGLGQSLRETLAGQMQHTYFPVTLDEMGADIHFHDLVEGSFAIGDVRITTHYLNHPALTLGYRLEMDGVTVVYSCDHEPYARQFTAGEPLHELDHRHVEFLQDADLVIHDSQFTAKEYESRHGWGHSPVDYVCEVARLAGVKMAALTHHDPCRTDEALDLIVVEAMEGQKACGSGMEVIAAADGREIVIEARHGDRVTIHNAVEPGALVKTPALKESSVLMAVEDLASKAVLVEAMQTAAVPVAHAADLKRLVEKAQASPPSLVIIEDSLAGADGVDACRRLRASGVSELKSVPIVLVGDKERKEDGAVAGVTRWLIRPFSPQYAHAHLQAWILRANCRWVSAPPPPDEKERLQSLRELAVLDTPAEERFDRITRVAAALADVPIAIVSLVDEGRQWFKSCHGLDIHETPKEVAFCTHVVLRRERVVVPDTLLDDRFADNPMVTGGPRIRFYAGFPVHHSNGACVGTLCLIDTRPRQFSESTLHLFEDLAAIVEQELNAGPAVQVA